MGDGPKPGLVLTIPFFFSFLILIFLFGKFREWARAFGRMGVQCPHFLKLAPTLGSVKSSIPHGDWRFYFFSNFISPKFRVHLDLHVYRWNFCFMGSQSLMSLSSTVEINFSFHFKHYNLTIRVVNFGKTFCTCSPSSLGQNPTVECAKK
jgi:hypothetical protein